MGWRFNWASSYESDFNFDYGISADDRPTHDVSPLMQANEVAAYPLLGDQQARDSMPPVATQNAGATGTNIGWASTRSSIEHPRAATKTATCGFAATSTSRDARRCKGSGSRVDSGHQASARV